ncbi:hypothetical protein AAZX31_07G222600 [Glycine max]
MIERSLRSCLKNEDRRPTNRLSLTLLAISILCTTNPFTFYTFLVDLVRNAR